MKNLFNKYIQTLETYIMFQIKAEATRLTPMLVEKNRSPIFLSMGAPTQAPPQLAIKELQRALETDKMHSYSTPRGEKSFLEAVALRMKNRFGVDLDPASEIFSLIGSKEGIANFIRALCNPTDVTKEKDIILIPDPGYASYKEMIKVSGGLAYPIPLTHENNYKPDLEDVMTELENDGFDKKKVKAVIVNYPNNPLGVCADLDYYKKVVAFCKKYDIILMSDLAYSDMYFDEAYKPHSVLEVEGAKDVTIEFHSLSKTFAMTGWRIGWACGNVDAVSFLGKLKSSIDTGIFKAVQKASTKVLNSKEGEEYIEYWNKQYAQKQQMMLDGFRDLGWDMDRVCYAPATFYLWLPIPPRFESSADFCRQVLETSGIVFVPGDAYGKFGEGFFRISFVDTNDNLKEVILRLREDGFTY